jgi:dipicolinate synthase subunit A
MSDQIRVAFLGGDERQIFAAKVLLKKGLEVALFGLQDLKKHSMPPFFTFTNIEECVLWADAIILPLPASLDGVHLNCSSKEFGTVRLSAILQCKTPRLLLGGKLPHSFLEEAFKKNVTCIDYFDSEELQLRNALPTAEGAIYLAMQELPVTLFGTSAAVVGYGRIGTMLAQRLKALGMRVYVYARRREALVLAELQGMIPMPLFGGGKDSSLSNLPNECRVLFNTVPVPLMGKEVLERIPKDCVLIDLASFPGGIDQDAAKALGIRSVWGTALPGKCAPESAGSLIGETLFSILEEHL